MYSFYFSIILTFNCVSDLPGKLNQNADLLPSHSEIHTQQFLSRIKEPTSLFLKLKTVCGSTLEKYYFK